MTRHQRPPVLRNILLWSMGGRLRQVLLHLKLNTCISTINKVFAFDNGHKSTKVSAHNTRESCFKTIGGGGEGGGLGNQILSYQEKPRWQRPAFGGTTRTLPWQPPESPPSQSSAVSGRIRCCPYVVMSDNPEPPHWLEPGRYRENKDESDVTAVGFFSALVNCG